MAIPVQCPECHKRYQAPDHLAGRRVKCKYCGVAFLIAADSRTESPDFELGQLDDLAALAETGKQDAIKRGGTMAGGTAVGHKSVAGHKTASGAPAAAAGTAPAAGGEDIDAVFQRNGFLEGAAPRTNKLYVFPMSRLLDHWLPPVLLGIAVLWMIREPWQRNQTGRAWVGFVRAAVFLLALFASVWPFTMMGVRAAARKLNFELPPNPGLRVLGTFAVPAALVAALWLIYEDATGLLLGTVTGIVVALPVLFLILRLIPREAPVTFAYAAGSFVLSIVVTAAAVFALNLMLVGILRSLKSDHQLAVSPLGPGLRWDELPQRRKDAITAATSEADEGDGSQDPAATGPTPDGPDAPTTVPGGDAVTGPWRLATTRESTGKGFPAVVLGPAGGAGNDAGASIPTVPNASGRTPPGSTATARADKPPAGAGDGGGVPFIPEAPPNANAKRASEIVKEVRTVLEAQDLGQIVRPAVPGPWVAVVRPDERGVDRVERWSTENWKPAGEARVARAPNGNHYAISPDGDLLAYVSDFPNLSVQVWSFAANRTTRTIALTNPNGAHPRLLGFTRPDQLVVQWRLPGMSGLEVCNAKAVMQSRRFEVPDFEPAPGHFTFSPDGQSIAIITRGAQHGALATYPLAGGRGGSREVPISEVGWTFQLRPTALAYTPDGTKIGALFEASGRALFATWPAAGRVSKALTQHVLAAGLQPPPGPNGFTPGFEGSAVQWLDDGKTYLLYGSSVMDAKDGTFLGEIGLGGVAAQSVAGPGVVELVRPTEEGPVRIDRVTLDLGKIAEARRGDGANGGASGEAAAPGAGAHPTTRRAAGGTGAAGSAPARCGT